MSTHSQVLLVGGGGLGVIAALSLEASSKARVTAVLRSNYDIVSKKGYHIKSCDHGELKGWRPAQVVNQVPRLSFEDAPFDYIIVASKNVPDCALDMADIIAPAVSPGITTVVLLQNGINIEKKYMNQFPRNIVLSGVSYSGSQEIEYGVVSHVCHDDLEIGAFCNPNVEDAKEEAAAKHFVSLYAASGKASCRFTLDVPWHRWKKLVYNASMNPLCAITGLDTGSLRLVGSSLENVLRNAMKELIAVAAAAGHRFPENLPQMLIDMDPVEDHFEPSMLQDVRKSNFIEFEYLVGEPLREGLRLGVPMPTIGVLYAQCQALQYRIMQKRGTS